MTFSVIIPTFNRPQVLARTLRCIEDQQCRFEFEVIVVDDASVPPAEINGLGKGKRAGWKLIRNLHNVGRAATRNAGIKAASGEFILFLDDDVWAAPDLLQAHYEKQREIGGGAVVGAAPISEEVPHDIWNDFYRQWIDKLNNKMIRSEELSYHFFFTGNASVSREALNRSGLFDESFKGYSSEDSELGYRLKTSGIKIVYQPKAVGYHYNIETLDAILDKKLEWGRSARIFVRIHPEVAEEFSVAGILAPGRKHYQVLLHRPILALGEMLCRLTAALGFRKTCQDLLGKIGNAYYAYGLKRNGNA
jgi:GT2 family glycosyltransferase